MSKERRSRKTHVMAFIDTNLAVTEEQRAELRSRFSQAVVDVLNTKLSQPVGEIFPIEFAPAGSPRRKKTSKA
jgi:hypothetical protein